MDENQAKDSHYELRIDYTNGRNSVAVLTFMQACASFDAIRASDDCASGAVEKISIKHKLDGDLAIEWTPDGYTDDAIDGLRDYVANTGGDRVLDNLGRSGTPISLQQRLIATMVFDTFVKNAARKEPGHG